MKHQSIGFIGEFYEKLVRYPKSGRVLTSFMEIETACMVSLTAMIELPSGLNGVSR